MALRTAFTGLFAKMSRLTVIPAVQTVNPSVLRASIAIQRLTPAVQTAATSVPAQCIHTQSCPLLFQATNQLWGAPLKKKKKMDPAVILARENKRKKKIEKQMKRLEKFGRRLKPIEEIEGDPKIRREVEAGLRTRVLPELSFEEKERRALLHKEWARYKMRRHKKELKVWARVQKAQQRALDELRFESEELYQQAIQLDKTLIPLKMKGPTRTPPIKGYVPPDGEWIEITKTYD